MYSTLAEFKRYLWINDSSQDTELLFLLNSSYNLLNKLLHVDSFTEWEIEEYAKVLYRDKCFIVLNNRPVKEITAINWAPYSWKFLIIHWREVIFSDPYLDKYVDDFWFIKVKYKYWYHNIPYDLQLMEMMLASWMYAGKWYEWVYSYRLWDESIQFWSVNWTSSDDIYFNFKSLYDKRKNFTLPY